jgi:hypothetical protein
MKKTEFELNQHRRVKHLEKEYEIVYNSVTGAKGKPALAIHQQRIDEAKKFLNIK